MSDDQLLPRLRDLAGRCANKNIPCATFFLTPAEQAEAIEYGRSLPVRPSFFGGYPEAERRLACFLPDYLTEETFDPSQFITAVHASAPFSSLSHRDFLGSLMGLGIERQCVGDIIVKDPDCWFFLTCAIASHVLDSMVKVGRGGVSLEEISLDEVPSFQTDMQEISFTVQSLRIDAILSGVFRISRSSCQELFPRGDVTLNFLPCMDKDAAVEPGDIISVRHKGKARILSADGRSKKGRTFVTAGIYR